MGWISKFVWIDGISDGRLCFELNLFGDTSRAIPAVSPGQELKWLLWARWS